MKLLYGQDLVNALRELSNDVQSRLWIAAPYIGNIDAIKRILGEKWIIRHDICIRLLTDINEQNNFNSETLKLFIKKGTIKSLVGLHAKIYIIDDNCLITSANLTSAAFSKRHEVGYIFSGDNINQIISLFDLLWHKSELVTENDLRPIIRHKRNSSEEKKGFKLPPLWKLPEKDLTFKYWLKPIGTTENPIMPHRSFTNVTENMHFSVTPKSVKENDILIAYGVGAKKLLSVYKVVTKPIFNNSKSESWRERFPWETKGENLTVTFGANWVKYDVNPFILVKEYLHTNPTGYITKRKGKTLGGLNFGRDKIELDPNFAQFVIGKIESKL